MKISYSEYKVLEDLIKSSDALESFRDGTLSFLDELSSKIEDAVNSSTEPFVNTDALFVEIELTSSVQVLIAEKLNYHPAVVLSSKLSRKK